MATTVQLAFMNLSASSQSMSSRIKSEEKIHRTSTLLICSDDHSGSPALLGRGKR